ncbi:protein DMP3-like [Primulina huaijiensis]|uniref:protein DMP3-like n=1 Tax=Primulina huaijiensis TaxID=1492673 RepID=UPI003CC78B2D
MSLRQRSASSNQPSSAEAIPTPPLVPAPAGPRSAISQALESTAHLANLLPTGTLLAFQLLTPAFTNGGSCDPTTRSLTIILLSVLSISCLLASFTDSFRASDGIVHYGFATFKGLWLFDNPNYNPDASYKLPDLSKYRLNFIDVIHAVLSCLVFGVVALRDKNVVSCLYPTPGREAQEVLDIVPIGVGLICSLLFVIFPTRRHGIGFPVTRDT